MTQINLETLNEKELIELNHRVVARIKALRAARTRTAMRQYRPGQLVAFHDRYGELIRGVVIRTNVKTVSVLTPEGDRWNVSPSVLVMEGEGDSDNDQPELLP